MKDGSNWNCKFFDMPEFLDDIYDRELLKILKKTVKNLKENR